MVTFLNDGGGITFLMKSVGSVTTVVFPSSHVSIVMEELIFRYSIRYF